MIMLEACQGIAQDRYKNAIAMELFLGIHMLEDLLDSRIMTQYKSAILLEMLKDHPLLEDLLDLIEA